MKYIEGKKRRRIDIDDEVLDVQFIAVAIMCITC